MIVTLQTLVFFRESLLNALDRLLRPYYNKFSLAFGRDNEIPNEDDVEEQVFAEFDEERGVIFYPPMYLQRYAAVSDCLLDERWCGKIEKVVDLGYHDMSFIKYLKEVPGIKYILGVDIESVPLPCSLDLIGCDDYIPKRENPLEVTLFKGNAADPDYRLIGCDAVISIEMIEHMLPHDLDRLIHTVFGFIKPHIAIFTTPNGDFNILFKALEKNGLRRLDHFFEWSREQFHDWCSNIIIRYPQYTVSCKGIGPGPQGTKHLGCCTQMALFVAKEYNKQQDLNLNSLALVSETPSPNSINNLISSWESIVTPNESKMIEPAKTFESFSELYSEKQSSNSILLPTPSSSIVSIPYQDKILQCNLDTETEKGYLMFDYEQMCFDIVMPRRVMNNRIYDIEDVYNRLNCTTLEVKKFSKTTRNLMAKNRADTLVHTREVVDEIRHLTKMLNLNKESNNQIENGNHTWCNINWGENAPFWNQYYKVVKQYNYPFESKSEECRILDLVSDEINRLIDTHCDEDFSFDVNKLEIPIEHLMKVVEHITDDVDRVKDLLEWNGYEIVGDVLIHSRLVIDYYSVETQEDDYRETDICSDWDSTDIHSTSLSDGSTIVPDYHARCLWRALDKKVRHLRSMLSADEDITSELDKVVCRLMKLALRTSQGRNTPLPARWMQCKLLDLLTLTEKTIERRKRHFIDSYPLRAIDYEEKTNEMIALEKIKEDNTASKIVNKYKHLINEGAGTEKSRENDRFIDFDDNLTISSAEFAKEYDFIDNHPVIQIRPEHTLPHTKIFHDDDVTAQDESKLERTQAWLEEDLEVVPYPIHDENFENSSIKIDQKPSKLTKYYKKRYKGKPCIELNCVICKKSHSKAFERIRNAQRSKENSRTKLVKKLSRKKSSNYSLRVHSRSSNKYVSVDCNTYRAKPRKKQYKTLYPTASKPIPLSLIELCRNEIVHGNYIELSGTPVTKEVAKFAEGMVSYGMQAEVAGTKNSLLMTIVTDDTQEIIALRRTFGTDADADSMANEDETLIRSYSSTLMKDDELVEKHNVAPENIHSQTIFLYDIDEPTTSKGIRHIGMDVQCGPDFSVSVQSMSSATAPLTRMPKMITAGIRIGDSITSIKNMSKDFGTCTSDANNSYKTIIPTKRSIGIKIKDSNSNLLKQIECSNVAGSTSLTEIPKMIKTETMVNSTTDYKMKSTDCSTCTNNVEDIKNNNFTTDVKNKDSGTKINEIGCSTDDQDLFDKLGSMSSSQQYLDGIEVNKSTQEKKSDAVDTTKDSNINTPLNIERLTSSRELIPKSNTLPQQTCQKKTTKAMQKQRLVDIKFGTNLPRRMKSSEITEISCNKLNVSSEQLSKTVTKLPKILSNQGPVAINLKKNKLNLPKHNMENTQKLHHNVNVSPKQLSKKCRLSEPIPNNKTCVDFTMKNSDSNIPAQIQCSTNTQESYDKSDASTEPSPLKASILKSELEERSVAMVIKVLAMPKQMVFTTDSDIKEPTFNTLNISFPQPFNEEKTLLKSPHELKIDDSTSAYCESVDGCSEIQAQNSLQTSDVQVVSGVNEIVGSPGRSACKYVKPKLCQGGIQVYSYKDKQSLSEDVMYQGEWQVNRPKVLTKRKCFNPLAPKKIDSHLKKKVLSKEKIKTRGLIHHNHLIKKRDLKPNNIKMANSEQESNKNEIKQHLKPPNAIGMGTIAKPNPFRNILKVPSKFPMSSLPSKTLKSNFILKKLPVTPTPILTKNDGPLCKNIRKNYIPLYLKKRLLNSANDINKKDLNLSIDSAKSEIHNSKEKTPKPLFRSKTEEIKRDLFKYQTKPPKLQYNVFFNEIEKKKSDAQQMKNTENAKNRDPTKRWRTTSPTSQNSSTCSSPCSVATVRAVSTLPKHVTSIRRPASSYITSTDKHIASEDTSSDKNRKVTKQCQSFKTTAENKENIPQTSKQFNIGKKESSKFAKNIFMGQKKDIFIAHVKEKSSVHLAANTLSKHKTQKSNVNIIPKVLSINGKRSSSRSLSLSKTASVKLNASLSSSTRNIEPSESSQTSNMVLVIEPQARGVHSPADSPNLEKNSVFYHRSITNWLNNTDIDVDSHISQNNDITSTMRELINETLDFIDDPFNNRCMIDSETVILSRDNLHRHADFNKSPTSFKTIHTSDDDYNDIILANDLELALERSFDITHGDESVTSLNDTRLTVTDFDALSFRSITSGSRLSGYLSADNEFSSSIKLPKCNMPTPMSVHDLYERRRDQPYQPGQPKILPGSLANQAFSGFTINGDPVSGDQPDPINFIDSETGSYGVIRQATSEELLISGRSSETFESCELDEDIVVPNWLFQLISQQQSAADEMEPHVEIVPMPAVEPMFDANGNIVEGPVGAGAGDGRGVHSDQSQDSSGRGTSVSSSETSSGPQSEAILIDPSAFVAQFELLRNAVEDSVVMLTRNNAIENTEDASASRQGPVATDSANFSRGEWRRTPRDLSATSDVDADVSSLDTDVPDSSDN